MFAEIAAPAATASAVVAADHEHRGAVVAARIKVSLPLPSSPLPPSLLSASRRTRRRFCPTLLGRDVARAPGGRNEQPRRRSRPEQGTREYIPRPHPFLDAPTAGVATPRREFAYPPRPVDVAGGDAGRRLVPSDREYLLRVSGANLE